MIKNKLKIIFTIITLGIIIFVFGYIVGYSSAINLCVKVALKATNINIDPKILTEILLKYGGKI